MSIHFYLILLGHRMCLSSHLIDNTNLFYCSGFVVLSFIFPKRLKQFTFPPQLCKNVCCFIFSPTSEMVPCFHICHTTLCAMLPPYRSQMRVWARFHVYLTFGQSVCEVFVRSPIHFLMEFSYQFLRVTLYIAYSL